jgi:endonuclease YncB( thermonuclease family)
VTIIRLSTNGKMPAYASKNFVRLELDPANAATGHRDNTPQKRTLAYVFLDDGMLLNAEIIKQGYGFALSRYPFARMEEFRRLEREAREQGRGLWAR